MSEFFTGIIIYLENLAQKVPLELFTFIGTVSEELIAPIPSPLVMTLSGSIMKAQNKALAYIALIALIGAIGKTIGAWLLYFLSDIAENIIVGVFGKFLGLDHDTIENIGKKFNGNWKDVITVILLRGIPVMPTSPVSVAAGIIKVKLSTYLLGTFIGVIIRNIFFLYLGYTGLAASEKLSSGLESTETIMQIIVVIGFLGLLFWGYKKRQKGKLDTLFNKEELLEKYDHVITPQIKKTYSQDQILDALKTLTYHHPDPLPKKESNKKPTLYVFRHGESIDNKNMLFSGWRRAPITEKGKEQAMILADKLANKKIDMLISSTQIRAIQTMEIAISKNESAKDLEIHTDERIKERSYGDLQGTSKLEYQLKDPEGLLKIRRSWDGVPPNGESIHMVADRVESFCKDIIKLMKERNINVAVSCHGNSIRGFRHYLENLDNKKTAEIETPLGQDYAAYSIE